MNETPNSRMTLAKQPPKMLTEVLSPSLVTYKTIGARAMPKAQVPTIRRYYIYTFLHSVAIGESSDCKQVSSLNTNVSL